MAGSFLRIYSLKESRDLDIIKSRRQAQQIRRHELFNRNEDYVHIYRLSEELINSLEIDIMPHVKNPRHGLSRRIKILCTLSFLANGSYQKILGKNANTFISQPSASRCIHEVVNALKHPDVVKKYIRFPQNASERQISMSRFYKKFKIPGVLGCIDGTLVSIVRPSENEERYYCRKGYHARNVQLITDADLNIINVDASYGGATHDSFIFNHSEVKNHLEELNENEVVFLLGDSGYAQRAYLMTPVRNADDDTPESYYNTLHMTARNSVERTIGVLKGRFRCLLVQRVLHYSPEMAAKIIIACCVLHNMCNRAGIPAPTLSSAETQRENNMITQLQDRLIPDTAPQNDLAIGRLRRNELIHRLWRSRNIS